MQLFGERRAHGVIASIIFPMMAAGVIVYAGMFAHNAANARQDAGQIGGVIVRGIMAKQVQPLVQYSAEEFPEVNRDNKRGRADRTPPYYGRVLSYEHSMVF